jgi:DNA repair exonuclease SbcCD ATPase subunit
MKDQIDQLEKMCKKYGRQQDQKVQAVLERNEQSRKEVHELKLASSKDTEDQIKFRQVVAVSQDKMLEEKEKMIKYLKRENIRARKDRSKIQSKLDETKSLSMQINGAHNEIVGAIDKTAQAIIHDGNIHEQVREAKMESKKLSLEVAKMQSKYMEEAKKRLQLQKSLATIITAVQSRVTNRNIVEESVITALQAESYSKCVMAGLDMATLEADLTGSELSESSGSDYLEYCYNRHM